MSLTDRLFGRGGVKFDLAAVQAKLSHAIRHTTEPNPELCCARFADSCRDANVSPVLPDEFDTASKELDSEGWRRFEVLLAAFDLEPVRKMMPQLVTGQTAQSLVQAFSELTRETPLLTLDVLGQSELRVEELTRRLFAAIGANVAGETAEDSKKKLHRLDYGHLLAEAEKAKLAASKRTEKLKEMQDEQEQRRTRRGKW